jgi:glycerol-3-phosphate acyltransferase PlsY
LSQEIACGLAYFGCFLFGSIRATWVPGGTGRRRRALIFVVNVIKGAAPIALIQSGAFARVTGDLAGGQPLSAWASAFFLILGHVACPWLRADDGKGASVALGTFIFLTPIGVAGAMVVGAVTWVFRRYSAAAAVCGLVGGTVAHFAFGRITPGVWFGFASIVLVLIRHEAEIDGLLLENA